MARGVLISCFFLSESLTQSLSCPEWPTPGVKKRCQNLLDMTWQDFLSEQGRARLASLSIDGERQRHSNVPSCHGRHRSRVGSRTYPFCVPPSHNVDDDASDKASVKSKSDMPNEYRAAKTIQAAFRRYKVRRGSPHCHTNRYLFFEYKHPSPRR